MRVLLTIKISLPNEALAKPVFLRSLGLKIFTAETLRAQRKDFCKRLKF